MSLVEYKVGELCSIKHGWAFAGEFFSDEGDYLLLTPGNAYMSGGIKIRPGKEKFYIGEFPKDYLLKKGDILLILTDLVQEAPLLGGSITIPEDNYFLHNQRLGLVENVNTDLVDQRFLYHLFNSPLYRGQVRGSASGATVRHTAPGRIYDCSVSIPQDLATQKNISCLLDSIDELVENNNVITEKLDEILSSTYQEWFINFKFPNYEQVEFVDGIPEGWELKSVSKLTQLISRGITPKYNDESGKSIVINQKCIRDNKLNLELARRQDKEIPDSKLVQKGDVLINSTGAGTLGRVTQVHEALPDTTVDTHVTIVRPLQEISSAWFGAAISNIESYIETLGEGTTNQLELKREVIGRIDLVCPAIDIQNQFQKIVEPMQQQILNLMKQNTHLRKLKETLLPRLMSGELDVSKLSSI
ncbi:restriction endonuclease subunit S (plasmid) [Moraxella osloensis]|nr:restriction endonuclease subunit S [Moraxella osloensis]